MSVFGTDPVLLTLEVFLGRPLHRIPFPERKGFVCARNCLAAAGGFSYRRSSRQRRESNNAPDIQISVAPSKQRRGHGILTVCPSPAAFAIGLGPTHPQLIVIAEETLGFRRHGISPCLRLLVPTFSLPCAPAALAGRPSLHMECSPTAHGLH